MQRSSLRSLVFAFPCLLSLAAFTVIPNTHAATPQTELSEPHHSSLSPIEGAVGSE
jgi:hypothetical protein